MLGTVSRASERAGQPRARQYKACRAARKRGRGAGQARPKQYMSPSTATIPANPPSLKHIPKLQNPIKLQDSEFQPYS